MPRPQILSIPERLDADLDVTGKGVCIAFVDAGFYPHPDLVQPERRIKAYADVTRDRPATDQFFSPHITSWHGTMTACAAVGNGYLSGGRYRGLAPSADVVLIRAGTGEGRILGKYVARALRFPLRHPDLGVKIVNVSLGVSPDDPDAADVNAAVTELHDAGVTVFAAAGNDPGSPPTPPGSSRDAITVGGVNDRNTRSTGDDITWPSSFTREGAVPKPDLLAPAIWLPAPMLPGTMVAREAVTLLTLHSLLEEELAETRFPHTDPDQSPRAPEPSLLALFDAVEKRIAHRKYISHDYQHVDGTSFASPITAAVAAQMLECCPDLTPQQIKRALVSTAEPLPNVPVEVQGAGLIRPREAVAWARAKHQRDATRKATKAGKS